MEQTKKRKIILALILIAIISVGGIGTYAYFITSAGRNEEQKLTVKTGNLSLVFEDNDDGLVDSIMLGESRSKEFRIKNTGTESVTTNMLWSNLVNTYIEESLSYTLEYKTSESDTWKSVTTTSHTNIPHSENTKDYNLATDLTVPAGETYYYKLTITFNDLPDINQEADLTAILSTKFKLGEQVSETKNILMAVGYGYNEKLWAHRSDITSIVFENTISPKSNAAYTYDISDSESSGVTAYLVPTAEDTTKYTAYIQADGKIMANPNSSWLFYNFINLRSITGLENLDTSNVTDMSAMFYFCNSLTNLDLSNFDTSKVTNMHQMFAYCTKISNLNINNFDTSKVIDMERMFLECKSLTSLNLSNLDTSNVTSMEYMFRECSGLTSLNLTGKFNTVNVTNMTSIFYNCSSLITLDVSNFNTSNVTSMYEMFRLCSSLTSLDLTNFDTSSVVSMFSMFTGCKNLTSLNLSSFDTSKVTQMGQMFSSCSNLTTLDLSNFNTNSVTSMSWMFQGCTNLTSLNISNFNTSNVSDMSDMFMSCKSLTSLNLSHFDTSKVTNMSCMFAYCNNLSSLNINTFKTNNVVNMGRMFDSCRNLTSLNLSNFDTSKVADMHWMFEYCSKLSSLNISNFNTSSVKDYSKIFYSVPSAIKITVGTTTLRTWCITASDSPKLNTSNFTIG